MAALRFSHSSPSLLLRASAPCPRPQTPHRGSADSGVALDDDGHIGSARKPSLLNRTLKLSFGRAGKMHSFATKLKSGLAYGHPRSPAKRASDDRLGADPAQRSESTSNLSETSASSSNSRDALSSFIRRRPADRRPATREGIVPAPSSSVSSPGVSFNEQTRARPQRSHTLTGASSPVAPPAAQLPPEPELPKSRTSTSWQAHSPEPISGLPAYWPASPGSFDLSDGGEPVLDYATTYMMSEYEYDEPTEAPPATLYRAEERRLGEAFGSVIARRVGPAVESWRDGTFGEVPPGLLDEPGTSYYGSGCLLLDAIAMDHDDEDATLVDSLEWDRETRARQMRSAEHFPDMCGGLAPPPWQRKRAIRPSAKHDSKDSALTARTGARLHNSPPAVLPKDSPPRDKKPSPVPERSESALAASPLVLPPPLVSEAESISTSQETAMPSPPPPPQATQPLALTLPSWPQNVKDHLTTSSTGETLMERINKLRSERQEERRRLERGRRSIEARSPTEPHSRTSTPATPATPSGATRPASPEDTKAAPEITAQDLVERLHRVNDTIRAACSAMAEIALMRKQPDGTPPYLEQASSARLPVHLERSAVLRAVKPEERLRELPLDPLLAHLVVTFFSEELCLRSKRDSGNMSAHARAQKLGALISTLQVQLTKLFFWAGLTMRASDGSTFVAKGYGRLRAAADDLTSLVDAARCSGLEVRTWSRDEHGVPSTRPPAPYEARLYLGLGLVKSPNAQLGPGVARTLVECEVVDISRPAAEKPTHDKARKLQ